MPKVVAISDCSLRYKSGKKCASPSVDILYCCSRQPEASVWGIDVVRRVWMSACLMRGAQAPLDGSLARDNDLHAPILQASSLGGIGCHRRRLTVSLGTDARGIDTILDQEIPHGIGTPLGKITVRGYRPNIVRIAFDNHVAFRMFSEHRGEHLQAVHGSRRECRLPRAKQDITQGEHQAPLSLPSVRLEGSQLLL